MDPTPPRRFTIADGMILIAALALAWVGVSLIRTPARFGDPASWWGVKAVGASVGALLPITLAVLILRLRRPCPAREPLWQQPGWVAGVAVAVAFAFILFTESARRMPSVAVQWNEPRRILTRSIWGLMRSIWGFQFFGPCAVLVAWAILWFSGRWKRPQDWVDWLGMVLGYCWISEWLLIVLLVS